MRALRRRLAESARAWSDTDDTIASVLSGVADVIRRVPVAAGLLCGGGDTVPGCCLEPSDIRTALARDLSTLERYYGYLRTHGHALGDGADAMGRRCDDMILYCKGEAGAYQDAVGAEEVVGAEDMAVWAYRAIGRETYRKQCVLENVLGGDDDGAVGVAMQVWPRDGADSAVGDLGRLAAVIIEGSPR